jgi:hypothetical protein
MTVNLKFKWLFWGSIFLLGIVYLLYDYHTNPCSVYNAFFLVNQKPIGNKYLYRYNNGNVEGTYGTKKCKKLKDLLRYYIDFKDSIIVNTTSGMNYFEPYTKLEILKYDYGKGIAFVKYYNSGKSQRTIREQYTIVSIKCLHDTLPYENSKKTLEKEVPYKE